ncbi:hypothetical protein LCGC14_1093800 [marine sediment metagenome]|uniref:Uncharacterized protein n=1 Tax=marine sediment metagenome TaxID=412755 RepID=A0A0F9PUS5_9ZZZZ
MTFIQEIRDALVKGQELFALTKKEWRNVYSWAWNERISKGKEAGILSCSGGEYLVWHEDFQNPNNSPTEVDKNG